MARTKHLDDRPQYAWWYNRDTAKCIVDGASFGQVPWKYFIKRHEETAAHKSGIHSALRSVNMHLTLSQLKNYFQTTSVGEHCDDFHDLDGLEEEESPEPQHSFPSPEEQESDLSDPGTSDLDWEDRESEEEKDEIEVEERAEEKIETQKKIRSQMPQVDSCYPGFDHPVPITEDGKWEPYPDRLHFFGAMLIFNLRHPMGESLLEFIWAWLKLIGVHMPSIDSIKAAHRIIGQNMGNRIHPYTSLTDHTYHVSDLKAILRMELSKPEISAALNCLPVDTGESCKELYQSHRWKNDPRLQTPCVVVNGIPLYIGEFYQVRSKMLRLRQFLMVKGDLCFKWDRIEPYQSQWWVIQENSQDCSPVALLTTAILLNMFIPGHAPSSLPPDSFVLSGSIAISIAGKATISKRYRDPSDIKDRHILRSNKLAAGKTVKVLHVILQTDDMSGNVSKRWNPHHNWYDVYEFSWF